MSKQGIFSDCRQVSNVSAFILESFPNLFATWLECTRFPSPLSLPMLSYLFILFPLHGAFLCHRFHSCIFFCSESLSGGINTNSGAGSVEHPLCKVQNAFLFFVSFPQPSYPTCICYPGWSHCVSSLANTIQSIKARSFHQGGQRLGCDMYKIAC